MGGYLFKDKASGIRQEDVREVQELARNLLSCFGIKELVFTGSAGKKHPDDLSGDIDVAFKRPEGFDFHTFRHALRGLGFDVRWSERFNIISTVLSYSNGVAQVDFLPIENLKMAEWGMYSEHYSKTKYKSALRNDIIRAKLEVLTKKVEVQESQETPVVWSTIALIPSRGIFVQTWSRASKRKNYLLKRPVMISQSECLCDDPDEIVRMISGRKDVWAADCLSAEDAMRLVGDDAAVYRIAREAAIYEEYAYPAEWDNY